jgi:lipopolysaccharide/colanic/teichoic acid biosynthesis glycosyltransferase
MQASRIFIWFSAALVGAIVWQVAGGSQLGLWPSLALLSSALVALAALTMPLALESSARLTERERKLLETLSSREIMPTPRELPQVQVDLGMPVRRYSQRIFDIVGAILILFFLSPLMIAIAIAIKLDSRGPVFSRKLRGGRGGKTFEMIEFRTMVPDAEAFKASLRDREEGQVGLFKIADDPRVTRVGRFLRKSTLDDLPQLFNVLRGEMSLVGPPPLPEYLYRGDSKDLLGLLTLSRPGVRGVWRTLENFDVTAPDLARAEIVYFVSRSVWSDLKLCTFGRDATRRRAIATMWSLAAEDRVAGVEAALDREPVIAGGQASRRLPTR